jgi:hypothetical protein
MSQGVTSFVKVAKSFDIINYKATKIEQYCVEANKKIFLARYATRYIEQSSNRGDV